MKCNSSLYAVLPAVFFIQFVFNGLLKCYGIFYLEFLDWFDRGPGETSLIAFTQGISITVTGPLLGLVTDKANLRLLSLFSCLLGTVGWLGSAFANGIPVLIFTYGILISVSVSILFSTSVVYVNRYYNNRPMLANGFMMSGTSAGGILLPFVIRGLISYYGIAGALILIAGLWLNMAIACMALTKKQTIIINDTVPAKASAKKLGTGPDSNLPTEQNSSNGITTKYGSFSQKPQKVQEELKSSSKSDKILLRIKSFIQPFINKKYITLCLYTFLVNGQAVGILQYYLGYAEEHGLNETEQSALLSVISVSDFVSRVILALIGDLRFIDKNLLISCISLTCGIFHILLPLYTSRVTLYMHSVIFGLLGDVTVVFQGILIKESVGFMHIGVGFGITVCIYGIAAMAVSPSLGFLVEHTGSYVGVLYTVGVMQIVGVLIFYLFGCRWESLPCKTRIQEQERIGDEEKVNTSYKDIDPTKI